MKRQIQRDEIMWYCNNCGAVILTPDEPHKKMFGDLLFLDQIEIYNGRKRLKRLRRRPCDYIMDCFICGKHQE